MGSAIPRADTGSKMCPFQHPPRIPLCPLTQRISSQEHLSTFAQCSHFHEGCMWYLLSHLEICTAPCSLCYSISCFSLLPHSAPATFSPQTILLLPGWHPYLLLCGTFPGHPIQNYRHPPPPLHVLLISFILFCPTNLHLPHCVFYWHILFIVCLSALKT